ncbi:MAG: hypothetical protein ACTHK7_17510 [Aureliella sp.]
MSNFDRRNSDDEFGVIEEAIRGAGTYVVPSDDLRPRTLEAARQLSEERRGGIRIGRFAAILLLCIVASPPIAARMAAWYEQAADPSSSQLQQRALEIAADRNIGPHWGLFEAFAQLRRGQAARLGQPSVK